MLVLSTNDKKGRQRVNKNHVVVAQIGPIGKRVVLDVLPLTRFEIEELAVGRVWLTAYSKKSV